MKKILWLGIILGIAIFFWFGYLSWFNKSEITMAQVSDDEYQKLLERDKNIPKEKVDKAHAEAKKIIDDISNIIAKNKPKYILHNKYSSHLKSSNPGRLGETLNDISWQSARTRIRIQLKLGLNKEDELKYFRNSLQKISMGDFFPISKIGDEATLVKNVSANLKMTSVGLHFIKGRARVSIYVNNFKRKTEKNEKELMEIVRLIEPLIIARENFDD